MGQYSQQLLRADALRNMQHWCRVRRNGVDIQPDTSMRSGFGEVGFVFERGGAKVHIGVGMDKVEQLADPDHDYAQELVDAMDEQLGDLQASLNTLKDK